MYYLWNTVFHTVKQIVCPFSVVKNYAPVVPDLGVNLYTASRVDRSRLGPCLTYSVNAPMTFCFGQDIW
jgi:hypothetical protein